MKYRYTPIWISFLFSFFATQAQQTNWPALVQTNSGATIKVYEPKPESLSGNTLKMRAAISVLNSNQQDPVFGVIWADVQVESSSDNSTYYWKKVTITNSKLPGEISDDELTRLKAAMEMSLSSRNISISQTQLSSQLSSSRKESELSSGLSTHPPKIMYTKKPSILVTIDGQPQLQQNPDWGVEQVVNTPFTIIKNSDQQYYLYGSRKWYRAASPTGPWSYIDRLPSSLSKINDQILASDTSKDNYTDNTIPDVVVSTEPAELIQSKGEASFSPVEGTSLLYMTNSSDDIFLDVSSQKYFVLASGRWYTSPSLSGLWSYVPATSLPSDFAHIPEGSAKDAVLANVAGTNASREAVMDAQLPQTAKVDRRNATANVTYDGDPEFESISGTHLKYAVNTPGTVLNLGREYYSVENGVWFQSSSPYGPWSVSTSRPDEVDNIPPSYPVYNTKYVYIYDATPDYVYTGYTPGYLGTYVYGPTIFYGTGYYYRPWRGRYYYPRPVTWGYNMRYNPWYGWGFGINLHLGWFNIGIGNRYSDPFWGRRSGWFGPSVYYPSYYRPFDYSYGPRSNAYAGNYYRSNNYNIYNNRRGVVTYERPMYAYNRNNSRPGNANNGRYYNNNGYNNGRMMPGDAGQQGRRNEPSNPFDRSQRSGDRAPGQPQNGNMNNRMPDYNNRNNGNNIPGNRDNNRGNGSGTPDNRLPNNNSNIPDYRNNRGSNSAMPDNRLPNNNNGNISDYRNNRGTNNGTPDNRLPNNNNGNISDYRNNRGTNNGTPDNRLPDNNNGNNTIQNRPNRPYQPQQNSGNTNPAPAQRNPFERSQSNAMDRNNPSGAPAQRNTERQPQVRERPSAPNSDNQRPRQEMQRPERQQGRENGGNNGGGGRSQEQRQERGSSNRRNG